MKEGRKGEMTEGRKDGRSKGEGGKAGRRATFPPSLRSALGSLAPGRDDMVRARVGDQLAEMLVKGGADAERRLRGRHVHAHHLALAGHRGRIERLEFLLGVVEALLHV